MTYPLEDTVCHSYSTCPIFTAACPQLDEFLGNAAEQYGRIQLGLTGCSFGYDEMEKKINHEYYAPETKVVPQAQQSPEVDSFDILDSFSRSGSFVFEPFGLPDIDEDELTDFDVTLVPPSPFVNDATNTLPSSLRDDNDSVVPEDSIYFFGSFSPVIEKPKPVSNVIEEFYPQRTKVSSGPKSPMTWEEFEEMALKGIEGY
ncbi:hypothetical protein GYMLUDRAFT_399366 [Collybiopsis luxurians FD-317 M1]|nr:hypothetical protein GYMLUDRAFT_399366 [Collybiopsis luxurians FD-317 M1]